MSVNGFTVGRDANLDIVTQFGFMSFSIRTSFTSKQRVTPITSVAADGVTRFANLPAGWEGSFKFDRADSRIDDFFAQTEANYYAGVPISAATITETIQEQSGSISQYLYTGVALEYDSAGEKKGDDKVMQGISFKASQRIKLS